MTREQLEKLCTDLFARVGGPVQKALDNAGVTMDIVNQVSLYLLLSTHVVLGCDLIACCRAWV